MAGSQIMTLPFEPKETLFYKSVKRCGTLCIFAICLPVVAETERYPKAHTLTLAV
jgi:hypothetical protein